jgi:hypothetical protein
MDLKDQGRREPTMADLEAFERLLRDSLQQSGQTKLVAAAVPASSEAAPRSLDANAMAELTRLIEAPLPFGEQPAVPASSAGAEPLPPQPSVTWQQLEAIPPIGSQEPTVFEPRPAESAPSVPTHDPLLAFEDELRRFDQRGAEAPAPVDPYGAPHGDYPVSSEPPALPRWQGEAGPAPAEAPRSALDEAEQRLAAQAALAAAAAGATATTAKRSRKIFYGLGGVALAGLAAIGVTFALTGRKPSQNAGVPVIAAKQEPTKERPANPGGTEIPDQNRQVLAPKGAAEPPKPAQAVNTTEQPVDLTQQVVRRESVRIVAPSPFQSNPGQAPSAPDTPPAANAPPPAPAPLPAQEPSGEPRRVQSVRLGDPAPPAPVPQAQTPGIAAAGVAIAAGAAAIPAIAAGASRSPGVTPTPAPATPAQPPSPRVVTTSPSVPPAAPVAPPKVETRPQSAVATAPTPRPTPPAATPPRPAPPAQPAAPRGENAPLALNPPRPQQAAATPRPAAPAATGGSGWSVQLASRPTQDDARAAATQLSSRFSSQLGRSTTVVSGEANGRTVFRVRAQGFSQAEANAACDRVKAAGGQCFVTR